jgi:hypothetical protein
MPLSPKEEDEIGDTAWATMFSEEGMPACTTEESAKCPAFELFKAEVRRGREGWEQDKRQRSVSPGSPSPLGLSEQEEKLAQWVAGLVERVDRIDYLERKSRHDSKNDPDKN